MRVKKGDSNGAPGYPARGAAQISTDHNLTSSIENFVHDVSSAVAAISPSNVIVAGC